MQYVAYVGWLFSITLFAKLKDCNPFVYHILYLY